MLIEQLPYFDIGEGGSCHAFARSAPGGECIYKDDLVLCLCLHQRLLPGAVEKLNPLSGNRKDCKKSKGQNGQDTSHMR